MSKMLGVGPIWFGDKTSGAVGNNLSLKIVSWFHCNYPHSDLVAAHPKTFANNSAMIFKNVDVAFMQLELIHQRNTALPFAGDSKKLYDLLKIWVPRQPWEVVEEMSKPQPNMELYVAVKTGMMMVGYRSWLMSASGSHFPRSQNFKFLMMATATANLSQIRSLPAVFIFFLQDPLQAELGEIDAHFVTFLSAFDVHAYSLPNSLSPVPRAPNSSKLRHYRHDSFHQGIHFPTF
uniref:Uncharacterized protein n=1 Tax=Moniliophthora roreri TaxID=221103 RepID=A0A0W0G5F3_MONRR